MSRLPKVQLKARPNPAEPPLLEVDVPRVLFEAFRLREAVADVIRTGAPEPETREALRRMGAGTTDADLAEVGQIMQAGMWLATRYIAARLGYNSDDPTFKAELLLPPNFDDVTMAEKLVKFVARTGKGPQPEDLL
jgi:hypothetical protein